MSFTEKPSFWSRLLGRTGGTDAAFVDPTALEAKPTPIELQPLSANGRTAKLRDPSFPSFASRPGAGTSSNPAASQMRNVRNAFTPSHPVSDPQLFAGRRALLEKIVSLLEDQHLHLVLYGDRGIGKTSILRILAQLAKDADYSVSYTSCGQDTEFDSLVRGIARRIPLMFHKDFAPTDREVENGGTLESLLHTGQINVSDATSLFENLRGTHFLILLDEFDRVSSSTMRHQIAELIKNLSDRGAPIQFVIAGVASNLTALFSHIPSIRRNLIGMPVYRMSEAETDQLVDLGVQRSLLQISSEARERLISLCFGLPYIAQLLGLHASSIAIRRSSTRIEIQDIDDAAQVAEIEIGLRLSDQSRLIIEQECRECRFDVLSELAMSVISDGEELPDVEISRLDPKTRSKLISATDNRFNEEAAVPYILLLSRHLEPQKTVLSGRVSNF